MGIKRHKPEEIVTKLRQSVRCRFLSRRFIAGVSNMEVWELTN